MGCRDGVTGEVALVVNETLAQLQSRAASHAFASDSEWCVI